MGPDAIPVVLDEQVARKDPELAVLSAMAHGHEEVGAAIAHTVLAAMVGLDAERIRLYVDLTMNSLSEATRYALEAVMQSGTYEYQSEFARKYVAQGREEGLQKGLKQGRQKGRHEGELAALLEVLAARGIKVDAASRQQLLACTQPSQLKRWLRKAVTVQSVHELFARSPTLKKAPKPRSKR
jgi:flagellar biosynthesis/type III secretory pathway protein FliH